MLTLSIIFRFLRFMVFIRRTLSKTLVGGEKKKKELGETNIWLLLFPP